MHTSRRGRTWLTCPAAVPHRCTGASLRSDPHGPAISWYASPTRWVQTHSQWCIATFPCARTLPLCLPDSADWPMVKLPKVLRPYRRARRPTAQTAPGADMPVPPPAAHVNSTAQHVALPASLTAVGRQAPWSGAALAAPPWALVLPAPSSLVTSQSVDNDIGLCLGRRASPSRAPPHHL